MGLDCSGSNDHVHLVPDSSFIFSGEDFEDLNEIIARYISPMASFARDIVLYKYYLDSIYAENRLDIEQKLKEERRMNPSRIPYVLTASTKFPGKFQISFAHPKYRAMLHEYMTGKRIDSIFN